MEHDKIGSGRRYQTLSSMSSILSSSPLSHKLMSSNSFQFWKLQSSWESIVGPVMAKESFIRNEKNGTLFIQVTNSIYRQQLFMMKQQLLERLHETDYGKQFNNLVFVIGPALKKEKAYSSVDPVNKYLKEEKKLHEGEITEKEKNWIINWVSKNVANSDLHPVFIKMMEETLKLKKGKLAEGFHPCRLCGDLCPKEETICLSCQRKLARTRQNKVILLLKEKPHYSYQETKAIIPCSYQEYDAARDVLIKRYKENIFKKYAPLSMKKKLLAMLIHEPESQITEEQIKTSLNKMPEKWWK